MIKYTRGDYVNIGDNLKAYRKKFGITQIEISDTLGIKQNTYSQYENNKRQPDIDTLVKLSNIFKCTIEDLVGISLTIADDEMFSHAIDEMIEQHDMRSKFPDVSEEQFKEFVKQTALKMFAVEFKKEE